MNKPIITVRDISKKYNINHELKANAGTVTFRDAIINTLKKPKELITGHTMKKEAFWALKNINFEVNPGEVVGIIGKNGSGKSTLLKIMSRITEPTTGEIVMNGRVASLLEVGTGFHPELTGRENVYFNGSILGMKKKEIDAKFDEIVAFSEVEKFLDTPVKFYSSGMYVRLAFSVAAHLEPDILIVDEVLAVGDAGFQKKSLGKMQDVAGEGRTVLFVSHNIASVRSLCNKAIWLDKGRVVEYGDIERVTDVYSSLVVADTSDLKKRSRSIPTSREATFTNVDIKNTDNKNKAIDSKKPMELAIEVDSKLNFKDPIYLHARISSAGQPAFTINSELTGQKFYPKKGKNIFKCLIEPSNLTGGAYSVDCSMLFADKPSMMHIDEVRDAKIFHIAELSSPANGLFVTQKEAVYWVDHEWKK